MEVPTKGTNYGFPLFTKGALQDLDITTNAEGGRRRHAEAIYRGQGTPGGVVPVSRSACTQTGWARPVWSVIWYEESPVSVAWSALPRSAELWRTCSFYLIIVQSVCHCFYCFLEQSVHQAKRLTQC